MILTRENIVEEVGFTPALDEFQVNPHSVDLRLAEDVTLEAWTRATVFGVSVGDNRVMVKTLESVKLPGDVMGVVYPRSSTNRRGIVLDMTGVVDANYEGTLMLPLTNTTDKPIKLLKGERIAQIVFHRLEKQAVLRLSKYHGTAGDYVPDKEEETAMLQTGMLEAFKAKFALSQAE